MSTCITLGPQRIKEKFEELLGCIRDGMFTLVVINGQRELFDTIIEMIESQFNSNPEYVNPPRLIRFSPKLGKQLFRYGVTQWAHTDKRINTDLENYLQSGQSFVFYRDSTQCNVHLAANQRQAVREICELFRLG